ncbi:MAG: TIM barrel protein [Planctomycetaceae bacterium]
MRVGLVSNCWKVQLDEGRDLVDLIGRAAERGLRAVELRQGCLGRFETDEQRPLSGLLSELPRRFPDLSFSVALSLPFLNPGWDAADSLFAAGLESAQAVAGCSVPHLRLVDLETGDGLAEVNEPATVAGLNRIADQAQAGQCLLSLEHARQPWEQFRRILAATHRGRDPAQRIGLCYDPCNLLLATDRPDPHHVTASLGSERVTMVHFKQSRLGRVLEDLGPGELDWKYLAEQLLRLGDCGPGLFEFAPHPQVWDALDRSIEYAVGVGLPLLISPPNRD